MPTLQQLHDDLWVAQAPHRFLGLALGARMAVVRLSDGGLLVYSPVRLDDRLRGQVEDLGPVRFIVAPNLYHHMYMGEWIEAFGDATVAGATGLARKRPDLRVDLELDDPSTAPWAEELPGLPIRGMMLKETVLLHAPSRTVISSDLTENFQTCNHWGTRQMLKLSGIYGRAGLSLILKMAITDKQALRDSVEQVLRWDFDRVVVAHGSVIERDGPQVLRDSYARYGVGSAA